MSLVVDSLRISTEKVVLVKDAYLRVDKGERVAVVGESGSGKSLTALSILKLLPENLSFSGRLEVDGISVLKLEGEELRKFRWKKISIIFQDPSAALNPLLPVGEQVAEAIYYHEGVKDKKELKDRIVELFRETGIPNPEERIRAYPHHLSGGLKQRVAIAMALACSPKYVLADEPTTALDVTVQKRILELLSRVAERGTGIVLITHDMGVVSEFADTVYVMYAGYTVEWGRREEVISSPLHPYTKALIDCSPALDGGLKKRLPFIPGAIPQPSEKIDGCPFHPRCPAANERCKQELPPFIVEGRRGVRCFLYLKK